MKNKWAMILTGIAMTTALPAAGVGAKTPPITAQTLIDRAQITDLLTRYYYNLGHSTAESFGAFYTDDAEMAMGGQTHKGIAGIAAFYKSMGDSPQRRAYAFNISISNLLITVDGNTAKAQLIFTEILADKQGDTPHVQSQGREYDTLVKVKGEWRIKRREIMPGKQLPEGWTN